MLIKSKTFTPTSDPRRQAGDEAERQMAFFLNRRFEDRDDVFLLHDLRIEKGSHAFQIDHLVVSRYGLFLIESKSIHGSVGITRHDERREHWSRSFRGRTEGMPSPVRQVQEQGRLLHEYLREHREQILGKLLFVVQKGFKHCPVDTFVGVSTSATFDLAPGTPLPPEVFKADEIAPEIERRLQERDRQNARFILNPLSDPPWVISAGEALSTARFLHDHHTPLHPASAPPAQPEAPPAPAAAAPAAGATCPACGQHPLAIAAGPVQEDGSRERYLACLGNRDGSCTWRQPLDATPAVVPPALPAPPPASPAADAPAAPRPRGAYYCHACKTGISREVASFCWERKNRFKGKAYCIPCQARFPQPAKA